ncbi:hypothetical protein [Calidithermus roseus]|uniref:Uncharacterized protein n=1 Tax=Calidithermus roseus TaxID=1644118 RepID=A0A399EUC3_9DEIN|nr:hypothetical protein [Calidithermus roseus]RIH88217.1 hypothetical protein Mrose_00946 [Calidithermus roseus]
MARTWKATAITLALAIGSLSLAAPAKVELEGKLLLERADKTQQSYTRSGGSPLSLSLEPGDRACVTQGRARLIYGNRVFTLQAPKACFEVARPRSFWDKLVQACQDVGVCQREAEAAFAKPARSRGESGGAPALYVPEFFDLPTLRLPIAGERYPKVLKLLDAQGKEIYREEIARKDLEGAYSLPADKLRLASRVQVKSTDNTFFYEAPVLWVQGEWLGLPTLRERGLSLFLGQSLSYAPAAYSYFLASGDVQLAQTLERQIRESFAGTAR